MLQIVALPIGNKEDITLRALTALKEADVIVGEEPRELLPLLKYYGVITGIPQKETKEIYYLNEHSQKKEIQEICDLCKVKNVALVSDCGTPVFCDPGAYLIEMCRNQNIPMTSLPGASSLMTLLSLSSKKLDQFHFYGFLPRDNKEKKEAIKKVSQFKVPVIIMDTPYKLNSTLEILVEIIPTRKILIGTDLTQSSEVIYEGELRKSLTLFKDQKKEFILILYP